MKKIILSLLTACTFTALPMQISTVNATETEQQISATLVAEPNYTITIPSTVEMKNKGTVVDVIASDVKNLQENEKISVTIASTSAYKDQMVLEADTSPRTSIRYQIISDTGELIETNASTGATGVGKEVVSFTGNETKQYTIKPVIAGRYEYNVPYTGSITFGIEVK